MTPDLVSSPHFTCIICGKPTDVVGFVCRAEWFATPLPLRKRFWRETNYAREAPSSDLIAAFQAAHRSNNA